MSLNQIKRKIGSIKTTSKITNAMKLVSNAKLVKQKKEYLKTKEYFNEYFNVFGQILSFIDLDNLFKINENEDNTLWITINSNMGLCGAFNNNINKLLKENIKENDKLAIYGNKGINYWKNNKKLSDDNLLSFMGQRYENLSYDTVQSLSFKIWKMFIKTKEINKIKLVYSKFVNAMTFVPEIINIFPFDPSKLVEIDFKENDFDFEPNKEEIIYELMPQYITNIIYGAFIESKISENASRSNSMNTATDNANKMLDDYKIKYNRQRQSKITSEINEIVSGFNS